MPEEGVDEGDLWTLIRKFGADYPVDRFAPEVSDRFP